MDAGDLLYYSYKNGHSLWLCKSMDHQNGRISIACVTDSQGNIIDPEQNPVDIPTNDPSFSYLKQISWTGPEVSKIMAGRTFPNWALVAASNTIQQAHTNAKTHSVGTTSNGAGFSLGTMFFGTSKAQNIYIIVQDNSHKAAQLWNGNHKTWCQTLTPASIAPGRQRTVLSEKDVLRHVSQYLSQPSLPQWVILILKGHPGFMPVAPQAIPALQKSNVLKKPEPPKKIEKRAIDSFRESCKHRFLLYQGYTESYEYCEHCDIKRPVPH